MIENLGSETGLGASNQLTFDSDLEIKKDRASAVPDKIAEDGNDANSEDSVVKVEENVDPIDAFLAGNKPFSLPLLLNVFGRICVLHCSKGKFSYQDFIKNVSLSAANVAHDDLNAYAALIYDAVLIPVQADNGQMTLQLHPSAIGKDNPFLRSVVKLLSVRTKGTKKFSIEQLKLEAGDFLQDPTAFDSVESLPVPVAALPISTSFSDGFAPAALKTVVDDTQQPLQQMQERGSPHSSMTGDNNNNNNKAVLPNVAAILPSMIGDSLPWLERSVVSELSLTDVNANLYCTQQQLLQQQQQQQQQLPHHLQPVLFDENVGPVRALLAKMRKVDMDMLFPQHVHDQVLAIYFAAMSAAGYVSYKQLVDMVSAVKEANIIVDMEIVSKTKLRSILTLLKFARVLLANEQQQPITLQLAPGINTFADLRDRHDGFLLKFTRDNHIILTEAVREEVIWQLDRQTRAARLSSIEKLTNRLCTFYREYVNNPVPIPPRSHRGGGNMPLVGRMPDPDFDEDAYHAYGGNSDVYSAAPLPPHTAAANGVVYHNTHPSVRRAPPHHAQHPPAGGGRRGAPTYYNQQHQQHPFEQVPSYGQRLSNGPRPSQQQQAMMGRGHPSSQQQQQQQWHEEEQHFLQQQQYAAEYGHHEAPRGPPQSYGGSAGRVHGRVSGIAGIPAGGIANRQPPPQGAAGRSNMSFPLQPSSDPYSSFHRATDKRGAAADSAPYSGEVSGSGGASPFFNSMDVSNMSPSSQHSGPLWATAEADFEAGVPPAVQGLGSRNSSRMFTWNNSSSSTSVLDQATTSWQMTAADPFEVDNVGSSSHSIFGSSSNNLLQQRGGGNIGSSTLDGLIDDA